MIRAAHTKGAEAALACFRIKGAGILHDLKRGLIGEPGRLFHEGPKAFNPGGFMHWRNVLWPSSYGTVGNWMGRLGTMSMVPSVLGALKGDPQEGRASNFLGTLGGAAGTLYGGMAGGMLGMPLGGRLGSGIGHGLGHILGSRPDPRQDYQ
jgi:hypothetical protein